MSSVSHKYLTLLSNFSTILAIEGERYKLNSDSVQYYIHDNPIRGIIILQLINFDEIYVTIYKQLQDIVGVDVIIEIFIFIFEFIIHFLS